MRKGRPIQTAPTSGQYGPRLLNLPETGTERICLRPAPKEGSPPPLAVHTAKEGRQEQKYNPAYGRRREKKSDTQHRQDHRGNRQQDGTNIK